MRAKEHALCLLAVLMQLFWMSTLSSGDTDMLWFKRQINGKPLLPEDYMMSAFVAHSKLECTVLCRTEKWCISFFYNDVNRTCVLYPTTHGMSSGVNVLLTNWQYFVLSEAVRQSENSVRQELYGLDHVRMTSYRVVTSPALSWLEARDACNKSSEMLAVLDQVDKARFLTDFLIANTEAMMKGDFYPSCFVGASRPEDVWNSSWPNSGPDLVWLNGQPLNLTTTDEFWCRRKPNNLGGDDNALVVHVDRKFCWDDFEDYEPFCYICQRSV